MFKFWKTQPAPVVPEPPAKRANFTHVLSLLGADEGIKSYSFPVKIPTLYPGVVPKGETPAIAMDDAPYTFAQQAYGTGTGFPGYQYLALLATRAEYRAFASCLSTEITREWITLNSSETAGDKTKDKITELTQALKELKLQHVIQQLAEYDCLFGRGQMFIKLRGHDNEKPLILSPKTIAKNSLESVTAVEPIWTSPMLYDALDPTSPSFYRPASWWMLGQHVHASRLMTVVTRPLPDMLKPAYNFSGMSMSQLAEPYVDNWLRTRQSVSNLISNFSTTALKTSMDQTLQGGDAGDLINRAKLFTLLRSNQGVMLLDKDREDLVQLNVPLGGLDHLQAQAQEHMCAVSRMPAIILTGISPSGLNASSEGEIKVFYDYIAAQQESYYRQPIETAFNVLQLSMYGEIDPDITIAFNPLDQMTPEELTTNRLNDSIRAGNYIDRGVIDPQEERERLARDPDSGYQGLDIDRVIELNPQEETDPLGGE